ncbi:MAG: helix-turn-helix transcriptional regulator [Thermoanaerobaculia bacterium]|jgi:transcriptional regulator with XRE-family HTH domain
MKTFAEIYDSLKDTAEYQTEELKLAFTESVLLRMEELEITRAELASRVGATKPYVTKLLKGNSNFTFESLVKLAIALDCRVDAPVLVPITNSSFARAIPFYRQPKQFSDSYRTTTSTPMNVGTQNYGSIVVPSAA